MKNGSITVLVLAALATIALALCLMLFRPYAGPIVFAVVIAIVFHPVHRYSRRIFRTPGTAALASMLLALTITAVPLFFLGVAVSRELMDMYKSLVARSADAGGPVSYAFHALQRTADWLTESLALPDTDVRNLLLRRLEQASASLMQVGTSLLSDFIALLIKAVIAAVTLFFLFRDGEAMLKQISGVIPAAEKRFVALQQRIGVTVVTNFYGGAVVGIVQGGLTATAFWILGINSPVLWGVVTGLFSLLPLVGSAAVWVPASAYLLFSGHIGKGVVLLVLGTCVIGLADNVVRPWIVSENLHLPSIYVFFALLGGMQIFGPIGLFLGPVILAITASLFAMLRDELKSHPESEAQRLTAGAGS